MSEVLVTATPAGQRSALNHLHKPAGAAITGVDHIWRLTFTGTSPMRVELDDAPTSASCRTEPNRPSRGKQVRAGGRFTRRNEDVVSASVAH